jgi:hypothetical protein
VVRHGTRGNTRERVEAAIDETKLGGPYATRSEASVAKAQLPDDLRPFADISRFGGHL